MRCQLTLTIPPPILRLQIPQKLVEAVQIKRHSEMVKPDCTTRRILSFLLLGLIVYGTTVQAVHKHGTTLPAEAEAVAVSIPAPEDSSQSGLQSCDDCLICQLQQSFSATLGTYRDLDPPAAQSVGFFEGGPTPASSFVTIRETGRAPPLTS
jgi:hypothetical protein